VVIKDMEIRDAKSVADWQKELKVMSTVSQSPYIADVVGYCSAGNTLTIVMEYFPKGDLYGILYKKKEYLSMLQRMRMARHCALGVAFLHGLHFLHRDIKSMNILVTEDYSCKLTDFGTAKVVSERQVFNTVNSGTPLWMAPEVKRGQYSYPADVYSLGLVLFELFEKQLPTYDQFRQTVALPPNFQSASVVMPCLHLVPEQRPQCSQVVHVLDKMIMNIVKTVVAQLPTEEQEKLKKAAGIVEQDEDSVENEILQLYLHLLHRPPQEVDALINKAFHITRASSSHTSPPTQMHQIPYGMPAGVPGQPGIPGMHAGIAPGVGFPMGVPVSGYQMGAPQFY